MISAGWRRRCLRYVEDSKWSAEWTLTVGQDHERYLHKTIGLTSGPLTMREIMDAYQRGTGKPMPSIPAFVARPLLRWNAASRGVSVSSLLARMRRVLTWWQHR